jgi:hypothetical protein
MNETYPESFPQLVLFMSNHSSHEGQPALPHSRRPKIWMGWMFHGSALRLTSCAGHRETGCTLSVYPLLQAWPGAYHSVPQTAIMPGVHVGIDAVLLLQTSIMPDRQVCRNSRERPLHISGGGRLDAPLSYVCAMSSSQPQVLLRETKIRTTCTMRKHKDQREAGANPELVGARWVPGVAVHDVISLSS